MGYKKKRSKDSLIASSIITGLLLSSAYLMGKPNTTYGVRLALGMYPVLFQYTVISHMLRHLPAFVYMAVVQGSRGSFLSVTLATGTAVTNNECKMLYKRAHARMQTPEVAPRTLSGKLV